MEARTRPYKWQSAKTLLVVGLVVFHTFGILAAGAGVDKAQDLSLNEVVPRKSALPYASASNYFRTDSVFNELMSKYKYKNATKAVLKFPLTPLDYDDFLRGKRGALNLAGIIKCATNCNPLVFKGYGCYCGFLGSGDPVDGIDTCCKMHDWCYSTTTCMDLDWHLPYLVPFRWKCNGGAPYCIPGKSKKSDRNSCSHQLCECDREFAMCLQKYLPCPTSKAMCKSPKRLWQNILMGFTSGHGMHHPHHHHEKPHYHSKVKPSPIFHQPRRSFRVRLGK